MTQPYPYPTHSFRAMGTQINLALDIDEPTARFCFRGVEEVFRRVEGILSRFKPTSELSYVNTHPGQWIEISPIFWDVLEASIALARATGGLFDPTLLAALEASGYDRDFDALRVQGPGVAPARHGNLRGRWEEVELDIQRQAVRLPKGVKVDFGGIAKGYTAQQAALLLSQWAPSLVDAGGDIAAGAPPSGKPGWPVIIDAPWPVPDGEPPDLVSMWLTNASLTTSGTDRRRWQRNGRLMHHTIDPYTGEPAATDLLSASVLAVNAAPAEAWATAGLVLGAARAHQDFTARGIAAVLVDQDRRVSITPAMQPYITWVAPSLEITLESIDNSEKTVV